MFLVWSFNEERPFANSTHAFMCDILNLARKWIVLHEKSERNQFVSLFNTNKGSKNKDLVLLEKYVISFLNVIPCRKLFTSYLWYMGIEILKNSNNCNLLPIWATEFVVYRHNFSFTFGQNELNWNIGTRAKFIMRTSWYNWANYIIY